MKSVLAFVLFSFALASATAAHTAELIMYEQAGCDWCERWHEDIGVVYAKTTEGKKAPLRRVDIHATLPDDIKTIKTGRFTPTFVLIDRGQEIGRIRGYPGEDFFWGLLGQILKKLPKPPG